MQWQIQRVLINTAHLSLCGLQLEVFPPADPQRALLGAHFHTPRSFHGQGPSWGLEPEGTNRVGSDEAAFKTCRRTHAVNTFRV